MSETSLLQLIETRRSVRQFTSEPVADHLLREIVRAGVWAPTGSNRQEVRFYVATDPADINAVLAAKSHIKNPQAAVLVYADVSDEYYQDLNRRPHKMGLPFEDVGAACQNMLLMAHALGLGGCWVNISPHWPPARALFKRFETRPTLRLVSAVFLGHPARVPDLAKEKHGGRPVQRGALEDYLVEIPPPSRVVCVHSIPRSAENLGSQALSAGLRNALHKELGDSPLGILDLEDHHWQAIRPQIRRLMEMSPAGAIQAFKAEVNKARQAAIRARAIPGVPFGWLSVPYVRLRRRIARLLDGAASSSAPALVDDPIFSMPWDGNQTAAYPAGCVVQDDEIRIPQNSALLQREKRWSQRLSHRLPFLFDPAVPLLEASTLRMLDWAQVVILDGDGNIADFSSRWAIQGLLNLALAKSLGAAAYSVNQTVAVSHPVLCSLIRYVYNSIDGVVVREPESRQRLLAMGVRPDKVTVGADCAVLVDDFDEDGAERLVRKFGIAGGSIGLILRGDMSPDLQYWMAAVREMREQFGREVVFLSSCEQQDLGFGGALGEQAGITVVEGLTDYSLFVPFIREFGAIVTQRYHPVYFAILARVPFVPLLGNTFKAQGLLQHFDYSSPVLDNPSLEELLGALGEVLARRDALRGELEQVHCHLAKLALLNTSCIRKRGGLR